MMRDIRNQVSETVILSVRSGDFCVNIDSVEGLNSMRRMADLGVQAPLYVGAASKVLLAGREDDEIEAYLGRSDLTALQESTIMGRNARWREIRSIRKRGFAESKGELFAGGGACQSRSFRTDRRGDRRSHARPAAGGCRACVHEARPSHRGAKFRQPLRRGRDQCCQSAEIRLPIDLFDQLNEFVDR